MKSNTSHLFGTSLVIVAVFGAGLFYYIVDRDYRIQRSIRETFGLELRSAVGMVLGTASSGQQMPVNLAELVSMCRRQPYGFRHLRTGKDPWGNLIEYTLVTAPLEDGTYLITLSIRSNGLDHKRDDGPGDDLLVTDFDFFLPEEARKVIDRIETAQKKES